MAVRRIVANLKADDPSLARSFYQDLLGLDEGGVEPPGIELV